MKEKTRMMLRAVSLLILFCVLPITQSLAQSAEEKQKSQDEIWSMEQSIYAGRAKADLSNYQNNTAQNYLSWPPGMATPMGQSKLTNTTGVKTGQGQEKLDMEFVDFTQENDTAIIYYRTHRTMLADGTKVDQRYQVTHTWIRENGKWRVFGGMARLVAAPAP